MTSIVRKARVGVGVGDGVAVGVGDGEGDADGDGDGDGDAEGEADGDGECVGVAVGVGLGVADVRSIQTGRTTRTRGKRMKPGNGARRTPVTPGARGPTTRRSVLENASEGPARPAIAASGPLLRQG